MTCSIEHLEARLKAAEDQIVLFGDMIDPVRRVVAARKFKTENDTSSPQIIKCGDCGDLCLGSEGCWQTLGSINVEASHTGDLLETTLGELEVPADRMGPSGWIRIFSNWQGVGANTKVFSIYFGAIDAAHRVGYGYHTAAGTVSARPIEVWNKNATNAQRCVAGDWQSGLWSDFHTAQVPKDLTEDTTAAVPIYFTGRLGAGGDTIKLLSARVEVLHRD